MTTPPRVAAVARALWIAGVVMAAPATLCAAEAASPPALPQALPQASLPDAPAASTASTSAADAAEALRRHGCPGLTTMQVQVEVQAASADDATLVCEGAARALRFLAAAGFVLPESVQIELRDELPGDMRGQAVGCYMPGVRRVFLLAYPAFAATGTWFRQPVAPELYRAAASHEVAHAVAACNTAEASPPLAANEYTAYVVMFATMAPDLRQRILAAFPGPGLANALQIHPLVYLQDPLQFAADAWRHYLRRRDGAAWLRDLVAGRIVQDLPAEGP